MSMRVDFYVLSGNEQRREIMACRLCEKAIQQDQRVFIYNDTPQQAQQLDDLLWTFRDGGFISHRIIEQAANDKIPSSVLIGCNDPGELNNYPVLINLSSAVPSFYQRFARIAEIVNQDEPVKNAGRQRFAFYREQGCNLHHHEL